MSTKKEQMIEVKNKMWDGMCDLGFKRDCWQNTLVWWICKGMYLVLEYIIKEKDNVQQ